MGVLAGQLSQKQLYSKQRKHKRETNNCDKEKKISDCTMVGLFQLRAAALLAILATTQCSAGDDSSASLISKPAPATHSAYFTEMIVQSDTLEPAKCSDRVLEARRTATVNKVCASGLKAMSLAASSLALGHRGLVVAGG